MIRTVIVDDEAPARANLKALLRQQSDIDLVAERDSGSSALAAVRNLRPDLVFLDIQMPQHDGFDVLEMLGGATPAALIFVTAYDQHALRAFDVGALDYLLKPYSDQRFHIALSRARERLLQKQQAPSRLVLKNAGQVLFLAISDIDWISGADYYASLHVGAQTHLLRRSLAELEQDLDPAMFCRIHRSTIINLHRLLALEMNADGEHEAVLSSGERLRVSRTYRKALLELIGSPAAPSTLR